MIKKPKPLTTLEDLMDKKKQRLMPLDMQKKLKEFMFENDLNLRHISEMINFNRSNLNMIFNRKENFTERLEYKLKKLLATQNPK